MASFIAYNPHPKKSMAKKRPPKPPAMLKGLAKFESCQRPMLSKTKTSGRPDESYKEPAAVAIPHYDREMNRTYRELDSNSLPSPNLGEEQPDQDSISQHAPASTEAIYDIFTDYEKMFAPGRKKGASPTPSEIPASPAVSTCRSSLDNYEKNSVIEILSDAETNLSDALPAGRPTKMAGDKPYASCVVTANFGNSGGLADARELGGQDMPKKSRKRPPQLDPSTKRRRRTKNKEKKARKAKNEVAKEAYASLHQKKRRRDPEYAYPAEDVVDVSVSKGGPIQCLVRWEPSWEPLNNLGTELHQTSERLFKKKYGLQLWKAMLKRKGRAGKLRESLDRQRQPKNRT